LKEKNKELDEKLSKMENLEVQMKKMEDELKQR
jgi:hypothetical protein